MGAVSGLELVTLVVAIVGCGLAIATFVWQWVAWTYEGAKVRVTCKQAFGVGALAGPLLWCVTATNVGRSPTLVTGWGFSLPDEQQLVMWNPLPMSQELPCTLEGGHEISFYAEQPDIMQTLIDHGAANQPLRPFVHTSSRGKVLGKPFHAVKRQ